MTENFSKDTLVDTIADNNQDSGIQFDEEDANNVIDNNIKERTKRKRKKRKKNKSKITKDEADQDNKSSDEAAKEEIDVAIEYIPETPEIDPHDPNYRYFLKVFSNFKVTAESINNPKGAADGAFKQDGKDREEGGGRNKFKNVGGGATMTDAAGKPTTLHQMKEAPVFEEKEEDDGGWRRDLKGEDGEDKPTKLSKKKWKLQNRLSVAELKQLVKRPDVVEMHDVTALDPKLLVHLKASRNSVPVARHWCFKRKYLAGKRGFEKPPFELPDFIKKTGIMEMRQALQDKEDATSLKTKMRAKIRPKMGKIDIDYQKLHDAFFRWQTKPKLTHHGDLYYEGKELEIRLKEKKPGDLSTELREALNMPTGLSADKVPPPWLIAMQRYGPPPSYPGLKIPGLNAPIPDGCSFGYHAGGWGKPPVDEFGKPLYGDVFNTQMQEYKGPVYDEEVDKTPWGELESESEEEESSEEETENKLQTDNPAEIVSGFITPSEAGLITPSGVASTPMGMETPDIIELRKKKIENEMEVNSELPPLYTILPEKATNIGGDFLGSTHVYDMSAVAAGPQSGTLSVSNPTQKGVEVTLAPEELDLVDTTDVMAFRYEQQIKAQSGIQTTDKNDLSDMVAQHAIKQKNKRKKIQEKETSKPAKKYKDFKF